MISQHYITLPFYIPRICSIFKNWHLYLFNYLLRKKKPAEYRLRNKYRLIDGTGTLAGTIAVVFMRREYGRMEGFNVIVDIGANMGSFMVYAAQSNPAAEIYCYEPVPQNFTILTQNISINSLVFRVKAFQLAVAANTGKIDITLVESPLHSFFIDGSARIKVDCTTLNEIITRHSLMMVDMLKMNCEGAEYEILENCPSVDFDRIHNIRLEYHNLDTEKRNGEWLAQFLSGQGYRINRFTRYRGVSGFIWASRD